MSGAKSNSSTPAADPPAQPPAPPPLIVQPAPTPSAEAKATLQAQVKRILDSDDAARAKAGTTTLIAVTNFTMMDDPGASVHEGRRIRIGEEFEVSNHDLRKYLGRGRHKLLDSKDPHGTGRPTVIG